MKILSEVTGKVFDDDDVVYYRNIQQSAFYMSNKVIPVDIFCDDNGKLVFAFKRKDHKRMIPIWLANKKEDGDNDV